ncbi:MAG: SusC/RagA family TonB-linked outer membrane protein [Longimicrobiales bacterium]
MSTIPWHESKTRALRSIVTMAVIALPGLPQSLDAQEAGRIQGTVTAAATGEPLLGAQVYIEGTELGTLTQQNGQFLLLNVPAGDHEVSVQLIGYGTATSPVVVQAGQTATLNFELSETALALEEIVVTGTAAEVRRKEIGNSLDAVTAAEIENVPLNNALQVLQGRAPGVTVMTNSGQVGAGSTIKIRGITSVSQDTEPLIYVDGVRIFNLPTGVGGGARTSISPLQDISAEDIARIEIVKGAAATTLYGTEASAGVIQIFTKRGVPGQAIWNAEVTTGVRVQGDITPFDDPTEMFTQCDQIMEGFLTTDDDDTPQNDKGAIQRWADPTCPEDGSWWEPGLHQNYALSVRGGAEDVTYYVSGNYGNMEGTLPTQGSKDGGARGNFSFSPFEALGFRLNTAYTKRITRWIEDGNNADGFLLNVGRGYRNYFKGGKPGDCDAIPDDALCTTNGYLFDAEIFTRSDHFILGFNTDWNPTEELSNRFTIGWDFFDVNAETTHPFGYLNSAEGFFDDENTRHTKLSLEYAGSYRNNFGDDFVSTFSVGGQIFRDRHRWTSVGVSEFAGPGEPTIETGADLDDRSETRFAETSAGFFLQELLGWRDRLFLTAGLRVDGNSAFGEEFGLQTYPKMSLAYVISDHAFWPTDWWDTFKLRGAVGMSGKAPGAFDKFRTWEPTSAGEGDPGFGPGNVGNPDIGPEETLEIEGGFDAAFLAGRLALEATAYQATTNDALVGITLPPSEGFQSSRNTNIGEIENRGLEFQVTAALFRSQAVDWRARVNATFMDSEVKTLAGEEVSADNKAVFREGEAAPVYVGDVITNPDAVANPIIEDDAVIGPVFPTQLFGFNTSLTLWDRLTLDALAEFQGGHYLTNYTGYQNARRGVWFPCQDVVPLLIEAEMTGSTAPLDQAGITAMQRARCSFGEVEDADGNVIVPDFNSDYWVEPSDFLKLRNVSLTYSIPSGWLPAVRNASVTLSAMNLWTSTDYTGTDPENEDFADRAGSVFTGGGFFGRRDYYQVPAPRTFLISFRTSF